MLNLERFGSKIAKLLPQKLAMISHSFLLHQLRNENFTKDKAITKNSRP